MSISNQPSRSKSGRGEEKEKEEPPTVHSTTLRTHEWNAKTINYNNKQ